MSSTAPQLRSRLPRLAEVAVQRARLTVVPRPLTRSRAPRVPFVIFVSVILLAGVIGLLLFNTSMQQASFRASALQQQADDLTARQEALDGQLQALRDPQHIAYEARSLGMTIPGAPGVLKLGTGKVVGAPAPALPGNLPPLNSPGAKRPAALDPPTVHVPARRVPTDGRRQGTGQGNGQGNGHGDGQGNRQHHGAPGRTEHR